MNAGSAQILSEDSSLYWMNEQNPITGYEFTNPKGMFQRLGIYETPEESAETAEASQEETLENAHQYIESWFHKTVRDAMNNVLEVKFYVP